VRDNQPTDRTVTYGQSLEMVRQDAAPRRASRPSRREGSPFHNPQYQHYLLSAFAWPVMAVARAVIIPVERSRGDVQQSSLTLHFG
jgi:hypothetical protein